MKPEFEEITLSKDDLPALLDFIKEEQYELCAIDTETNSRIEKTATLWGISFCFNTSQAFYIPVRDAKENVLIESSVLANFIDEMTQGKKLLMHNGIYDILVLENNLGLDLTERLYHDTILSKHLIDEERPHGLKETSVKYLGDWADKAQKELLESIIKNGGKATKENMEMFKADTEVLAKYACWDVMLTLMLFNKFNTDILKSEKLTKLYYEEEIMPLYKEVVIPMKRRGFPINVEHFQTLLKDISVEITRLEKEVLAEIKPLIQEYEKESLKKKMKVTLRSGAGRTLCEKYNYDKTNYPDEQYILDNHFEDCERIYCEKNERISIFNLASTDDLSWLIYTKLRHPIKEKTDTGAPKVDKDVIEELAKKYKFASILSDLRKLSKLKSTYIEGVLDRHIDGVLYSSFLLFGTTSGRFSSTSPNLQNLPRQKEDEELPELVLKYTNAIKKGFVATEGTLICNADYSQLEPCSFADVSGDTTLQKAFKEKLDLYSSIAIEVNNLHSKYSADKKADNYLKNHEPKLRQDFKAIALGIVYGAEDYRVSQLLECTTEEASNIIERYLNRYPGLRSYMKSCDDSVLKLGYVESRFGRRRRLFEAKELLDVYGNKLLDRKWARSKGLSEVRWTLKNALNLSKNHPIQALAAHIVNRACIKIARRLKAADIDAYIAAQVHDEITVIGDRNRIEEIKNIVRDCMENTTKISVPLIAEPIIANNWAEAK